MFTLLPQSSHLAHSSFFLLFFFLEISYAIDLSVSTENASRPYVARANYRILEFCRFLSFLFFSFFYLYKSELRSYESRAIGHEYSVLETNVFFAYVRLSFRLNAEKCPKFQFLTPKVFSFFLLVFVVLFFVCLQHSKGSFFHKKRKISRIIVIDRTRRAGYAISPRVSTNEFVARSYIIFAILTMLRLIIKTRKGSRKEQKLQNLQRLLGDGVG